MEKSTKALKTKKGGLKSKILLPTILIIIISILTVGFTGYFTQKNTTYDLMATMTNSELKNFEEKVTTESQNAEKARESVNNNLIRLAKSVASQFKYIPDEQMNETLTQLTQELDIDRINIGDESGIAIFSSDRDGLGFDFTQFPDSAEYLKAIDDKGFTAVGENVETPEGSLMHFIGAARQDAPQFIQIGILSSTIDGIVTDTNIQSLSSSEEFAEGGHIIVADNEGEILNHKNEELVGTNLSEHDWGKKMLEQKDGKLSYKLDGQDEYMSFINNEKNIIAASMPSGTYTNSIKMFGIYILIAAVVILALTIVGASVLLDKVAINKLQNGLLSIEEIEKGNLCVDIDTSGNDEVSLLMSGLDNMKKSLKDILTEISNYVENISSMSHSLSDSSEQTTFSGQQIAASVTEIATGANDQVRDVHESRDKLENLSDRIEEIARGSQTIEEKSTEIEGQTKRSVESVLLLRDKFIANEKSTQAVNEKTLNLAEKSSQIENIIEVINDIAAQTNLLALNASIEAARAGEHGKGFAVVAEEIRKLAEESVGASGQIEEIINSIEKDINDTRTSMEDVSSIVSEANEELENTVEEFTGLKTSNDVIVDLIGKLQILIDNSNKDKDEAMLSMDNVAAVSEETAASTEEISASTEQQASTFESISHNAEELNEISKGLLELVSRFNI